MKFRFPSVYGVESLTLPFLYQTRTILRQHPHGRTPKLQLSRNFSRANRLSRNEPQNAQTNGSSHSFLRQKSVAFINKSESNTTSSRSSTITPAERTIFDRIFDDLAKGINPKRKLSKKEAKALRIEIYGREMPAKASNEKSRQVRAEHEDLLSLFSKALSTPNKSPPVQRVPQEDHEHRFPPALREISARAKDFVSKREDQRKQGATKGEIFAQRQEDAGTTIQNEPTFENLTNEEVTVVRRRAVGSARVERDIHDATDEYASTLERIRREQFNKIKNAFAAAIDSEEGDLAVWRVCEKMVFPMILQLGLRANDTEAGEGLAPESLVLEHARAAVRREWKRQKRLGAKRLGRAEEQGLDSAGTSTPMLIKIPKDIPPLDLISTLYPASLLLALRLLHGNFPTSPLSLILLPTIRSLGPTSYVLGASTKFYNELLYLRWNVYSDLRSMGELLAEMEREGVDFDIQTLLVLRRVLESRRASTKTTEGEKQWWNLGTTMKYFEKLCSDTDDSWMGVVRQRLREKATEMERQRMIEAELEAKEAKSERQRIVADELEEKELSADEHEQRSAEGQHVVWL